MDSGDLAEEEKEHPVKAELFDKQEKLLPKAVIRQMTSQTTKKPGDLTNLSVGPSFKEHLEEPFSKV